MNKKFMRGLILIGVGILLIITGLCVGFFSTNVYLCYFAAAFAAVGLGLSVAGWIISVKNFAAEEKSNNNFKNTSLANVNTTLSKQEIPVKKPVAPTGMKTVSFSFCGNCGNRNAAGSIFCTGCGGTLGNE